MTESVPSVEDHHLVDFVAAGHPVILCTDDTGVFDTCLSQEYTLAAGALSLTDGVTDGVTMKQRLFDLAVGGVSHAFVSREERHAVLSCFARFASEHGLVFDGYNAVRCT